MLTIWTMKEIMSRTLTPAPSKQGTTKSRLNSTPYKALWEKQLDYSRSIKNDLRDDFNRMEGNVDRIEDQNREMQDDVRDMIDKASERFDNKRESLQTDTELKINALRR